MIKHYKTGLNCYIKKDILQTFKLNNKIVCFIEKIYTTKGDPIYYFLSGKPSDKKNNFKKIFYEFNDAIKYANEYLKNGGQVSVIPEGALHARKNNMEGAGEDFTSKGIPVVDNKGE